MRFIKRLGWFTVVLLGVVLTLKILVGDVYRISSPSMEPTLFTGEWVFVRFDREPPERGQIVVLRQREELIVKRCMGVGNETVRLHAGDVWVDGGPLSPRAQRGAAVCLYDQAQTPLEDVFDMGSSDLQPWRKVQRGVWELDGRDIPLGSQAGLLRYRPEVVDGWPELAEQGTRMAERRDVGDILLECSLRVLGPTGQLRFLLFEQGDRFTLSLTWGAEGQASYELSRRDATGLELLASGPVDVPLESWFELAFANVDDHLAVRVGERWLEPVATGVNSMHPSDYGRLGLSYGNRVMLGGEGCWLQLRDVRIFRDHHYGPGGEFATQRAVNLGGNELFLLGDNSPASRDSRMFGALLQEALIGRAIAVVWPPSAWRRIGPRPWLDDSVADE